MFTYFGVDFRCTRVLFEGQIDEVEKLTEDEITSTFAGMNIYTGFLQPETNVLDAVKLVQVYPFLFKIIEFLLSL